MSHEDVFRNGVALLAFVIAFYALVARERKTPDMVHAVYRIAFLVLAAVLLGLASDFFDRLTNANTSVNASTAAATPTPSPVPASPSTSIASPATTVAAAPGTLVATLLWLLRWSGPMLLALGLAYVLYRLRRDWNRQVFFRDDKILWNTPVGRFISWCRVRFRKKKRYQTNPMSLPKALIDSLGDSPYIGRERIDKALAHYRGAPKRSSISAVFEIHSLVDMDDLLTDLASRFLQNECFVQYTSCTRHPIEFLTQLETKWNSSGNQPSWEHVSRKIVVVDAYTPHFGFTDTVYRERTDEAKEKCLAFVTSHRTYAGVHTGIASAFNKIRKSDTRTPDVRTPAVVFYEGCSALVDLESNEQYRIFLRHVLPSERLWGGMFTVFVEPTISAENRSVLEGVADIFVPAPERPKS
jgi:hypothetical protein